MITINESTSIVAVPTKQLTIGQSSIVYVSSTADVGQLVTVFDVQGFLSTPQSILVSSTQGCDLGSGISSAKIEQRFGYITLRSITNSRWNIVNENAFRTSASDYTIGGLQFSTIHASTAIVASTATLNSATTRNISTTTATFLGPLFVSSLGSATSTFLTDSLYNTSNYMIRSSINVVKGASVLSGASTVGPVTVQSNMNVAGEFTTASTMFLQSSLITTQRILVGSNITVQGLVTTASNIQCFTSASTFTTVATSLIAGSCSTNNVVFDSAQMFQGPNNSLYVSSALHVPNLIQTSTLNLQEISTPTIRILSTIFTPAISISNANILNRGGSLSTSSIYATSIQYNELYGLNATSTIGSISTQTSLFSTLFTMNELYVNRSAHPVLN